MTRTQAHAAATPFDAQGFMGMDKQAYAIAAGAWQRYVDGTLALQNDAMALLRESAGRNLRAMIDIARCGNPVEALALQARYTQENFADWADGGRRMAERVGTLWQENAALFENAMAPFAGPEAPH